MRYMYMYFLFEINESNVDSFQACVGEVYGDREIRWLFGSWWITAVIRQVSYIRERENAFRVAAERQCHRAEYAFTRGPGRANYAGSHGVPASFYASPDVILGICNGVELSRSAPSNVRHSLLYVLCWNMLHTYYIHCSFRHIGTVAYNYCFIFDTRALLRHRGLSMLRVQYHSLNSFAAISWI